MFKALSHFVSSVTKPFSEASKTFVKEAKLDKAVSNILDASPRKVGSFVAEETKNIVTGVRLLGYGASDAVSNFKEAYKLGKSDPEVQAAAKEFEAFVQSKVAKVQRAKILAKIQKSQPANVISTSGFLPTESQFNG